MYDVNLPRVKDKVRCPFGRGVDMRSKDVHMSIFQGDCEVASTTWSDSGHDMTLVLAARTQSLYLPGESLPRWQHAAA